MSQNRAIEPSISAILVVEEFNYRTFADTTSPNVISSNEMPNSVCSGSGKITGLNNYYKNNGQEKIFRLILCGYAEFYDIHYSNILFS